jgi:hypothetical protein
MKPSRSLLPGFLLTLCVCLAAPGQVLASVLTTRDLENYAKYDAESFGIGGGAGFNADFGLGGNATAQGSRKADGNGNLQTGKASLTATGNTGYGRDAEEDESVTRSGINTRNITLTDEEGQKARTGKTAEETIASLHTSTTTQTAEQNSGYLENNFDRERVEDEINLQVEVTQQFSQNVRKVQGHLREEEERLRKAAKTAEEEGDSARAAELHGEADEWQEGGVLLNMLAGGLLAPTDSAGGILANTLAPGISYEIGQYFKEQGTEGSAAHLIAHTILGGAVQAAGGNDALAGALAAGGAEALAPILSNYLYGKDANDLTTEQKETVSTLLGFAGNAIGGTVGNGAADVVGGGQAARTAAENNYLSRWQEDLKKKEQEACKGITECSAVELKWAWISGKQDIGFVVGMGGGVVLSGKEALEGLYVLVTNFPETMAALKALATSEEARAQFGDQFFGDLEERAKRLEQAFNEGGWEGATVAGVESGRFLTDFAGLVTGVKGSAQVIAKLPASARKLVGAIKGSGDDLPKINPNLTSAVTDGEAAGFVYRNGEWYSGSVPIATNNTGDATSIITKTQLRTQLAFQEAGILDANGGLTPKAVLNADIIDLKDPIRNPAVVKVLTSDGSNISDWRKFTTKSVTMPNGQRLQIHFYKNIITNKVDYLTQDYKVKGVVKP